VVVTYQVQSDIAFDYKPDKAEESPFDSIKNDKVKWH
jgi:hypothetical protein